MSNPVDGFLARRREARQLIIDYKRTFATPHGKNVLLDLMNRFHMINDIPSTLLDSEKFRAIGRNDAVKHILRQANYSVRQLDALLKGEETNVDSG